MIYDLIWYDMMAKSSCKWHGDNGEWTSTQISGIVELGQSERTLPKQSIGNWLYRSTSASNLYLTWFGTLAWTPSPEKHVNQLTFGCMFESNFDLCSISKMKARVDPNPLANIQPMHKQYDLWIIYVYTKFSYSVCWGANGLWPSRYRELHLAAGFCSCRTARARVLRS
jgi:hypothetical protein